MLEGLKKEVVCTARAAENMGLCRHRSGNFSMRDKETGLICMTPTGVDRQTMRPDDVVVMDMDARVVESLSGLKPTSEALMHIAAYDERPDITAIVHTHSKFALVFAVLRQPIPCIMAEMGHLGLTDGVIPVAEYGRQGSEALAEAVRAPLRRADALLMAAHGVLTVDRESLDEALLKAAYVEEAAEVYLNAKLLNGGREPLCIPVSDLALQYPKQVKG